MTIRERFGYLKALLYPPLAFFTYKIGNIIAAKTLGANVDNISVSSEIIAVNVTVTNTKTIPFLLASGHITSYAIAVPLAILAKKYNSKDLANMSAVYSAIPLSDAILGFIYNGDLYQLSERGIPLWVSIPIIVATTGLLLYYNYKKRNDKV